MEKCDEEIDAVTQTETANEREEEKIEIPTPARIPEQSRAKADPRSVKTKVPEIEVHLYRRSKGPIDVFKSNLGGWDQDQLEVQDILEKYGFKSVYAFNPEKGRGVPIRFHPRNGRSLLPYKDGSVIYVDGEPKLLSIEGYS
ncbi:hypothetical protein ACLOJK_019800 [Asimina triloba]